MPAMRADFLSRLLRIVLYLVILAWGLASLPGAAGAGEPHRSGLQVPQGVRPISSASASESGMPFPRTWRQLSRW